MGATQEGGNWHRVNVEAMGESTVDFLWPRHKQDEDQRSTRGYTPPLAGRPLQRRPRQACLFMLVGGVLCAARWMRTAC